MTKAKPRSNSLSLLKTTKQRRPLHECQVFDTPWSGWILLQLSVIASMNLLWVPPAIKIGTQLRIAWLN